MNILELIGTYANSYTVSKSNLNSEKQFDDEMESIEKHIENLESLKNIIKFVPSYLKKFESENLSDIKRNRDLDYLESENIAEESIYHLINEILIQKQIIYNNKKITIRKIKMGKKIVILNNGKMKLTFDEDFLEEIITKKQIPLEWYSNHETFYQNFLLFLL